MPADKPESLIATDKNWIWMPHPGHFIGADDCRYRLCTYVNGFIVSTIGEYYPDPSRPKQTLGTVDRDYFETMVFRAQKNDKCEFCGCEYIMESTRELDCKRYATCKEAKEGHMEFCWKCDRGEIK